MPPFLLALAGALVFAFYDAVGYFVVTTRGGKDAPGQAVAGYRVIQTLFQVTLAALLATVGGGRCAGAFVLIWWFGACDLLYYVLLRQAVPATLTWIWWTPAGLAFLVRDSLQKGKLWKRPISRGLFVAQSLAGVAVGYAVAR